jgi:poly(3-hydroxybutyrate) depolymerase
MPNYCSAESSTAEGYTGTTAYIETSDGNKRCYSVITPTTASEEHPAPVLFWFHGSGADASLCGQVRSPDDDNKTFA